MRELVEADFFEQSGWIKWCFTANYNNGDYIYSTGHNSLEEAKAKLSWQDTPKCEICGYYLAAFEEPQFEPNFYRFPELFDSLNERLRFNLNPTSWCAIHNVWFYTKLYEGKNISHTHMGTCKEVKCRFNANNAKRITEVEQAHEKWHNIRDDWGTCTKYCVKKPFLDLKARQRKYLPDDIMRMILI